MSNHHLHKALFLLPCIIIFFSLALAADSIATNEKELININTASAEELQALPGIGPSISKRIVAFREENGPYKKIEDIMKVKGIGEKSFQKIKHLITVGKG